METNDIPSIRWMTFRELADLVGEWEAKQILLRSSHRDREGNPIVDYQTAQEQLDLLTRNKP